MDKKENLDRGTIAILLFSVLLILKILGILSFVSWIWIFSPWWIYLLYEFSKNIFETVNEIKLYRKWKRELKKIEHEDFDNEQ